MEIERFVIDVSQAVLDDLAVRLADTRWPDEIPCAGWDYGTDPSYLRYVGRSQSNGGVFVVVSVVGADAGTTWWLCL